MGKDKTGDRTKGNQKPSSSLRSAEILGGTQGFVGFSGLKDFCYVPAASQQEDDNTISSEFRVTLRKMAKKDATTKIKALQEFESLCNSEDIDSIKTTLPFWPRIYSKLCLDAERRVREAVQHAHSALLTRVGKQFAPYLRTLMPAWILAMRDPYKHVASSARRAFEHSFSEEKRAHVMIFCSKEVLDHIMDNLLVQSPQTLSDNKNTNVDDNDNKYSRIVYSSLKGLGYFLKIVANSHEKRRELIESILPLLKADKFWKFAKHQNPLLRGAWFDLVKNLLEFDAEMLKQFLPLLSKTVFCAVGETEMSVIPYVWNAFLQMCIGLPECWDICHKPESVFNHLYGVLRDGGRGSATDSYPLLLPILSVIPEHVHLKCNEIYINFFRAFSTSLRKQSILIDKFEVRTILTAMFECIKYASKQDASNSNLWNTIIEYQILGHMKSSWSDTPLLRNTPYFEEVAKLLIFWNDNATNLTAVFWSRFLLECQEVIKENDQNTLDVLYEIFAHIRGKPATSVTGTKFTRVVKFEEEISETCVKVNNVKEFEMKHSSSSVGEQYSECVASYVAELIKNCFDAYNVQKKCTFKLFTLLLSSFPSDKAYMLLLNRDLTDSALLRKLLLDELVLPLISSGSDYSEKDCVEIFMSIYNEMDDATRRSVLFNLKPTVSYPALICMIKKMIEREACDESAALWLKSPQLGCRMVKAIQQLCAIATTAQADDSEHITEQKQELIEFVKCVFSNGNKTNAIFSTEYLGQMVKVVSSMLNLVEMSNAMACDFVKLVVNLLEPLLSTSLCWHISSVTEIMCILFHILCYSDPHTLKISEILKDFIIDAFESYCNCTKFNDPDLVFVEDGFLSHVIEEVKNIIGDDETTFAITVRAAEIFGDFLRIFYQKSTDEDCDIMLDHTLIHNFLDKLIPSDSEWEKLEGTLSSLYMVPGVFSNSHYFQDFPITICEDMTQDQHYIQMCVFLLKITLTLCSPSTQGVKDTSIDCVSLGQFTRLVVFAIHGECHAHELLQITSALDYDYVSEDTRYGTEILEQSMKSLLAIINDGNKKHIVKLIRNKCTDSNPAWCMTLSNVIRRWINIPLNAYGLAVMDNEEHLTIVKQVLIPYMLESQLRGILKEEVGKMKEFVDPYAAVPSLSLATSVFTRIPLTYSEEPIQCIYILLASWRVSSGSLFSTVSDLSILSWREVSVRVAFVQLLTVIVRHHSEHLTQSQWDFTLCSLADWIQSFSTCFKAIEKEPVIAVFACAVCKCAQSISDLMAQIRESEDAKKIYPKNLMEEWKMVYSSPIFSAVFQLFIECTGQYRARRSVIMYNMCFSVTEVLYPMTLEDLQGLAVPPLLSAANNEESSILPEYLQTLLNYLVPMLSSPNSQTQFTAYSLLNKLLPSVVEAWNGQPPPEEMVLLEKSPPTFLMTTVEETGILMNNLENEDFFQEVTPHTSLYMDSTGYLLAFSLILSWCSLESEVNQQMYASFLRHSGLLYKLLNNLFKLMLFKHTPSLESGKPKSDAPMFTTNIEIGPSTPVSKETLQWTACQLYLAVLTHLPAVVRTWWTNLHRIKQQTVDKFTTVHVSSLVIAREFQGISQSTVKFDNMMIKTRPGAREVVATYTIDEASMELTLKLSSNHPLSPVTFEDHKRVGVSQSQWKNWLFGLNTMLSHRNAPLLNSLIFWKKNVDKKFEGLEECYICYYVLHGTSHQLPKLSCRTCKKKFHPACMYKWFNTSNNSTCPICRSLF